QILWPDHALQGSANAAIHADLDLAKVEIIVRKGFHLMIDSYSTFFENDHRTATGLDGWLRQRGFRRIFLAGLATDFCVAWSAEDAIRLGYEVFVVEDACRGIGMPTEAGRTTIDDARTRLLATRRFWPLCVTQACTSFNDNLVKNALVVLALIKAGAAGPVIVALSAGLFILPYTLLSATAGQLADRHDKARLIRIMKLAELLLVVVAGLGLWREDVPVLLLVLVALGVQATFFGPLKYGILPDHLRGDELIAGNGLIEATTFISILLGTIAGGGLVLLPSGPLLVAATGLAVSALGLLTASFIPPAPPTTAEVRVGRNIIRETLAVVRQAHEVRPIWLPILGLSWFWTIGAT
ncbi:MAG: isochorismatase family protein, partial [Nevskiales bacterium]